MYIQNKLAASLYKLVLGLISLCGFWMTLALFGATAWRLFSTWTLLIGAVYFCVSALLLALSRKRDAGDTPCAMLEGMLIVAFTIQTIATISCVINDDYLPGLSGFAAILTYYILPVLTLLDWCLFNKKGQWRAIDPFYWLSLPLAYAAMIIVTANMLPSSTTLLYPIAFLDYNTNGLWEMLSWLALLGLLTLIFGYILILLDAFMGGTISKHIVLPRIRTVTVEDDPAAETEAEEDEELLNEPIEIQEDHTSEEAEIVEPDEIITTTPKAPRAEAKAGAKTEAKAEAKTANENRSDKTQVKVDPVRPRRSKNRNNYSPKNNPAAAKSNSSKSQTSRKRKINDITKPKPRKN